MFKVNQYLFFYANAFIENIRSLFARDTNDKINSKKKNAKYEY